MPRWRIEKHQGDIFGGPQQTLAHAAGRDDLVPAASKGKLEHRSRCLGRPRRRGSSLARPASAGSHHDARPSSTSGESGASSRGRRPLRCPCNRRPEAASPARRSTATLCEHRGRHREEHGGTRSEEPVEVAPGASVSEAILLFDTPATSSSRAARCELPDRRIERRRISRIYLQLEAGTALAAAEAVGGNPTERPLECGRSPAAQVRLTVHAIELSTGEGEPVRLVVARDVTRSAKSIVLHDAFARILAHELRTPVTSIYGGAQLMVDPTISEGTRREAALTVASEAERLIGWWRIS